MSKKIACYIFAYDITKGMKSLGPKGLLKSKKSKELINCQINNIQDTTIDINVIIGFGSDKIKKKIIHDHNDKINIIYNNLYETTNQGYALELILNHYQDKKYSGCLIMNDGLIINQKVKEILCDVSNLNFSKLIYVCSDAKNHVFNIGFSLLNNSIQHMFFNLTNNLWTEIAYIDNSSLLSIKQIYNTSMRNMFLFEILNKSMDMGIKFVPVKIKNSEIIKINGIKDSNKIKETI